MKILLKCPTRSRPRKVLETLGLYIRFAARPDLLGVAVSCDTDDPTMENTGELDSLLSRCAWHRIFRTPNTNKIEACNANMTEIEWDWDIVILVSDDMIPKLRGYDDILRNHMLASFPDRDGILWCNDGYQGQTLNTLCVFGRTFYDRQGYLYSPAYKSLFCDTELTDQCRTIYANKCLYIPYCLIRHEHPGTGFTNTMDKLYERNQTFWNQDMYTYIRRKTYAYDWSVLIPTIPGREASLQALLTRVRETVSRVAPTLRVEYCLNFDNREQSVGLKRQQLLQNAHGKYMSFIDDDDSITDAYVDDLVATIQGDFPVMRLRGQIAQYTFTHSLDNKLTGRMSDGTVFLRPPNHLNPMMTDVAKFVAFRDAVRGEDLDWTIRMARAGLLTHEYQSDPSRIHYLYAMGSRTIHPGTLEMQQQTSYETMLSAVWTPGGAQMPSESVRISPGLRLGPHGFVSR